MRLKLVSLAKDEYKSRHGSKLGNTSPSARNDREVQPSEKINEAMPKSGFIRLPSLRVL